MNYYGSIWPFVETFNLQLLEGAFVNQYKIIV